MMNVIAEISMELRMVVQTTLLAERVVGAEGWGQDPKGSTGSAPSHNLFSVLEALDSIP